MQQETNQLENNTAFPEDLIYQRLNPDELEVAVNFLTRRFPNLSIQEIVHSLNIYHHQKQANPHIAPYIPALSQQKEDILPEQRRPFKKAEKIELPEEKKIREKQQLRMVAQFFCQKGKDFAHARLYLPDLYDFIQYRESTKYHSMLQTIVGTVLKELRTFIKKQCQCTMKDLSEAQKITIKTSLINAHCWMGRKNIQAFDTFLNFISKHFIERHKIIKKQQAINLHTAIIEQINDPSIDLVFQQPPQQFGQRVLTSHYSLPQEIPNQQTQELKQLIAEAFLEQVNFDKTVRFLVSTYGPSKQFEKQHVEKILRMIAIDGIRKLQNIKRRGKNMEAQKFPITDRLIDTILTQKYRNVQYSITQVYLDKIQKIKGRDLILQLTNKLKALSDQELASSISEESRRNNTERDPIQQEIKEEEQIREETREQAREETREETREERSREQKSSFSREKSQGKVDTGFVIRRRREPESKSQLRPAKPRKSSIQDESLFFENSVSYD